MLDRLADALAAAGEHAQAIATARRRLALDPLHEPAHRRLIAVYAAAGDRAAALEQYRDCVRVLDRELGVRPLDETTALYHAVLEGTSPAAPRRRLPVARRARARRSALVGRDRELGALREAYAAVGPDGRLAVARRRGRASARRASRASCSAAVAAAGGGGAARCFQEEAELAYGVVSGLLRDALAVGQACREGRRGGSTRSRACVPELGPPPERRRRQHRRRGAVLRGGLRVPARPARRRMPGALLVDDAHWADEASLRLLLFLARRLAGRPLLLCRRVAARGGPRRAPARRGCSPSAAPACLRLGGGSRPADVAELVRAAGHDDELAERAAPRERRAAVLRRRVPRRARARRSRKRPSGPLPGGVRELLERAPGDARRAGGAGRRGGGRARAASFDPDTLRDASGRSDDEVVAGRRGARSRAASSSRRTRASLEFRHEQERGLVYERHDACAAAPAPPARRRGARARDRASSTPAWSRTTSRSRATRRRRPQLYRVAGDRARALYANAEALGHYRAALALGHPERRRCTRRSATWRRSPATTARRSRATRRPPRSPSPELAPEVEHRIGEPPPPARRVGARRGVARRQRSAASRAPRPRARPPTAAWPRTAVGSRTTRRRLAADALALAEAADDAAARAQAHNILGILAASRGDGRRGGRPPRAGARARGDERRRRRRRPRR